MKQNRSPRNYLLDASYQMRFTLFMVAVAALLMTGLGLGVMHKVRSANATKANNIRDFVADPGPRIEELQERQAAIGFALAGTGLVICCGLFAYGIWLTHKIAGPVHKIGGYLDELRQGRFVTLRPLRKGDNLQEFYDHFAEAHDALRARQAEDVKLLGAAVASVREAGLGQVTPDVERRLAHLEELAREKQVPLG